MNCFCDHHNVSNMTYFDCSRAYHHKKDALRFTKVEEFEPHGVYYHGCLEDFCRITKWKGSEVGTYYSEIHLLNCAANCMVLKHVMPVLRIGAPAILGCNLQI